MIFFFFSFLATLLGGISAGSMFNFPFVMNLSVNNPFSGIIAFWPFIIVLVLLLLAILWYQTIKNMRRNKSHVGRSQRQGMHSTVFLGIVTVLIVILMAAPYVIESFDNTAEEITITNPDNQVEMILTVHGMDCTGCEGLINRNVSTLEGVESVAASHTQQEVVVVYDKSKVSVDLIAQAIEDSGYTVVLE